MTEFSGTITSFEESHYGLVFTIYDESRPWAEDGIRILVCDYTNFVDGTESIIEERQIGAYVVIDTEHWEDLTWENEFPALYISKEKDE